MKIKFFDVSQRLVRGNLCKDFQTIKCFIVKDKHEPLE